MEHTQPSEDETTLLVDNLAPATLHALAQSEIEDFMDAGASLCGALDVLCTDLLCDCCALLWGDWGLALCAEHAPGLLVAS